MMLLTLFWSFFQVGLFSIGGGYAALPLIQNQAVHAHGWLTPTEFTDLITIAEMTPGPIALNASTFVGTKVAGLPGAIIATAGCVTPSCIIVLILAYFYFKYKELPVIQGILSGLRPAVVSLIASAGMAIMIVAFWGEEGARLDTVNYVSVALCAAGLFVLKRFKVNQIFVILGCGIIGGAIYLFA